jgi:acylphosphatase
MAARRLLIRGKVQGVFYRGWSERNARALGLDGWVRNLSSGEVELVVSGPEEALNELVRRCWRGPSSAEVEDIEVSDTDEMISKGFGQRRTL